MKSIIVKSVSLNILPSIEVENTDLNDRNVQIVVDEMTLKGYSLTKVIPITNSHIEFVKLDKEENPKRGTTLAYTESLMLFFEKEE